ncbi:phosphodiesterase [Roseateles saccharophilus]|uniref:Calcineurin-like phosphoesterase family protein n=1 Tax=Roseateles saccharophilus TaxID=304 RepID=A0A4R3U8H3_ROSSA|nr:phosphodiesterase [Roseateles saccharophilus]MDG0836059.1 phosphodiesterase [Roseateles saccharophilus]TCU82009.1 calcineurin-like phosphoesterase family protein [Roseateles saccharophilus]
MLIAQISDPHVRPEGELYQGLVDSNRMFFEALQHLKGLDRRPDLLLLTGDLVDEGRPQEYAMVRRLLAGLDFPYLVIPGNHDRREQFREAFADHAYLPREGPQHFCHDEQPVRIVGLDSCVPGLHHGDIDPDGLTWLRRTFEQDTAKPTIVMLHHPPFMSGIPYMDKYRYLDPTPLESVLRSFTNIELILSGHVHRVMFKRWAGTMVCSCPSSTTEIALQMRSDAAPMSYIGPPACLLHWWDEAHGIVTHLSHIGTFAGPYPFA